MGQGAAAGVESGGGASAHRAASGAGRPDASSWGG